jgi:hypothetical protein
MLGLLFEFGMALAYVEKSASPSSEAIIFKKRRRSILLTGIVVLAPLRPNAKSAGFIGVALLAGKVRVRVFRDKKCEASGGVEFFLQLLWRVLLYCWAFIIWER